MYTLYYLQDSCSLATHTILKLLGHTPKLVSATSVTDFGEINLAQVVPVLTTQGQVLTEGAAIIMYLLENHPNDLLPPKGQGRQVVLEHLMLANASMHPAYSKLFFAARHIEDEATRTAFFTASAQAINQLWQVIENKIGSGPYLRGTELSPADVLLAVYSRWGQAFPVDIKIGVKAQRMIDQVINLSAFQAALQEQNNDVVGGNE